MNTATFQETQAVASGSTAITLAVSQELLLIPLSKLRPSSRNVRKSGGTSIPELASSITRVGLLQNLTVVASPAGEHYEVVAGRRRLAALKLLAKRRKLAKDHEVHCLLVQDDAARTVSLTENVQREAMSPIEELSAWKDLVAEGRPVEDIAADFGVTPLVVQRRLKLANVSPRLLADFGAQAVTLEQLMALAITDDHAAQEAAFYESPQWQRSPDALRDHLTSEEIDASRDAVARFVGLEAYEQAGGGVRRDLFADDHNGIFLTDGALLDSLARDKLAPLAEQVRSEGWAWVDAMPRVSASDLYQFQRARSTRREPTKTEAKAGDDPDLPVVSETSDNFISKLRISVTPISATPGESVQGFKAFDVAFLHDVVSRAAQSEWLSVPWTNDRPNLEHAPSRWSYRSVSGENELKSTTFLTCPWQTASGWAYVSAVAAVCRQLDALPGERYLPARRISLQSPALAGMIKDAHDLAEWVATYDELLDKRQLQHNDITVVRYRRGSTNGRNMIVSSTSELRLLGVLVRRRLDELNLQLDAAEVQAAADKAKRDALSISGDIVLRAAKRGVSAGEMIGLVLSRHLLAEEFRAAAGGGQVLTAYFLLDDYASWLSQPESRIADILALNVEEREEGVRVVISIVESKYVAADGLAKARRDSKDQLLATLGMFREALFGDPGRLDRDVWLARLADMLIDAEIPPGMTGLMERARAKLREGDVEISLRGYSHVYVHTSDAGSISASDQELLEESGGVNAWQEVFDRPDLRKLVEAYSKGSGGLQARAGLGAHQPWNAHGFKKPAPRVPWLAAMGQLANGAIDAGIEAGPEPEAAVAAAAAGRRAQEPATPAQSPAEADAVAPASAQDSAPAPATSAHLGAALSELVASKFAGGAQSDADREEWAQDVTNKLKAALNSYGLQAAILGTRLTPNGCLVRLAGSDRLRVEDIENKRTQLLTTHAINLVTVQPKPGEIVVTVAGSKRQAVSLWELWSRRELNRNVAGINTSFLLGLQEINGTLLYLNLGAEFGGLSSHEPHSLVAGATGSGKSVLIQALILDIAATNSKDLVQLILIDPKMGVDYAPLADLPHMRDEIVTTKEKAGEVLEAVVQEMEDRYRAFAKARARDLPTYNSKVSAAERLPMVFLIHDEFADWMLDDVYKSAVGAAVQRLGVKARAAGIHLIFAAQRPDKDVMPMQLPMRNPSSLSRITPHAKAQCRMDATIFLPTPKEAIAFSSENVDLRMRPLSIDSSKAFLSHI